MHGSLRGIGIDSSVCLNSVKVKVYDVEEKKLIEEFDSVREAERVTGVPATTISRLMRSKGRRAKDKNNYQKLICFR
jgi:hypothetical protein